jgi:hypothetical protein
VTRRASLLLAALATLAAVIGAPAAAQAAPVAAASTTTTTTIGADVSYPQCDGHGGTVAASLTGTPAFAVVGVNGGVATSTNPCLRAELTWAATATGGTSAPAWSVYVNTANPGLAASWWPSSNTTKAGTRLSNPNGACAHRAGAACAFVYGWSLAEQDVLKLGGFAKPGLTWWLDVEAANTWSSDRTANRVVLEGMTAGFKKAGMKVGLYALRTDWADVVGTVPWTSSLTWLPTWLAGAYSHWGAMKACTGAPLTRGGRIAVTQYLPDGAQIDSDVACAVLHAPTPVVRGTGTAGTWLSASAGAWPAGTSLAYQWRRNGVDVKGATSRSYYLHQNDRGAVISVRVTGAKAGYSRASATSAGHRIP